MRQSDRVKLHFGPYRPPRYRLGQRVECEARGTVVIAGISDGRIPWPIGKTLRAKSLVLFKDLAKAVRTESEQAVCHWWGVGKSAVRKWRRALRVPLSNQGTHQLRVDYAQEPAAKAARRKAWTKARDPARREKIAAAKRGKKRPAAAFDGIRARMLGKKLSEATRRKMSEAHRRRGTRPPAAGIPWTQTEDRLISSMPIATVKAKTGRSLQSVYSRRSDLQLPDARRKWTRQEDRLVRTLPAASVVAQTGHSLWAVYTRRWRLKQRHRVKAS